jgi:hypothetical protein
MARPLVFNLVVSNVPGPQQPLYLLGRRIKEIYPFVPLSPQNHALSIGMISYDGRVYFGLAGDRDVVADLDDLSDALREALREQPVPRAKAKPKPKREGQKPAPKRKRGVTKARKAAPKKAARGRNAAPKKRGAAKAKPAAKRKRTSLRARVSRRRKRGD